jgi:hypothetical protein
MRRRAYGLCFILLMLFVALAVPQVWRLDAQQPSIEGHRVGEVVASLLSVAQFQSEYGQGWIIADGRDVSGSRYHSLTGRRVVPNLQGRVLRMPSTGEETGALAGSDQMVLEVKHLPRHNHKIPTKVGDFSAIGYAPNPPNGNGNNWSWGGSFTDETGESQPFSIVPSHGTVLFFVKVN